MGLGQYDSIGEYCVPHTASEVFLVLVQELCEHIHLEVIRVIHVVLLVFLFVLMNLHNIIESLF